jgi:hypothetical protein
LQLFSEASTGCGNGLQLISDASTALAWIAGMIAGISQFEAACQRFLSRFRFNSPSNFVIFSWLAVEGLSISCPNPTSGWSLAVTG